MIRYWNRLHVSAKIIIAIVSVLALPIAIFGAAYLGRETRTLRENASAKVAEAVAAEAAALERRLEKMQNAAHLLSIEVPFPLLSAAEGGPTEADLRIFDSRFTTASRTIRFLVEDSEEVRVYHDNPELAVALPSIRYVPKLKENPFFRAMATEENRERWVYDHSGDTASLVLRLGKLCSLFLTIPGSRSTTIVEVSMLTSRLFRGIRGAPFSGYLWAAELPDGRFLLPEDPAAYAAVGIAAEDIPAILGGLRKGIRGAAAHRAGRIESEIRYEYLPAASLYLYAVAPTDESVRRMAALRTIVLRGVLLLLVAVSAVVAMIVRANLKRLDRMVEAIRRVEAGDFDAPILVEGEDEIAELSLHFQRLVDRLNTVVYEKTRKETAKIESKTRALLAQINAHFIYNALESVRMRAYERDAVELPDVVSSLARMLRYGMSWDRQFVSLEEELKNARDYVDLVNFRFDFETRLEIEVPAELRARTVIKMILQPLVENSVKHGMEAARSGTGIRLRAYESDGILVVEHEDDGPGIEAGAADRLNERLAAPDEGGEGGDSGTEAKGDGIGLMNVAERIRLYCGDAFGIALSRSAAGGTVATLRLPLDQRSEEGR